MKFLSALNLKSLTTLLALVLVSDAAGEEQAIASSDSAVVKLTSDTFKEFLESNPLVLAEFFAPWCGHCKALGPHFSQAADILVEKKIPLAQIDCTEQEELCREHGIQGYPTLKVFKGIESEATDYQGPRTAEGIVNYMIKQSLPAVNVIPDAADLDDLISEATTAVIVETGSKSNETFYKLADSLRDSYLFAQTDSADYVKKYGKDKILIFVEDSEEPIVYKGQETYSHLIDFIKVETIPFFGEMDGSSYKTYAESGLPLAYLFYNTPEERESWKKPIVEIAKGKRGSLNFVALDASKYGRHAESLNMEQEFPLFVIHDVEGNKKYGFPQNEELTAEAVIKFVEDYSAGKIEPKVKTEEIPKVQENQVFKVVATNHEAIINDSKKDVLVKYYAPWCGHCKRLAPTFEELAEIYASEDKVKDKVLIADLDATLNDVNVEIKGYPTLILYPANDKEHPVVHEGGRDLQSLIAFVKEKGSFHIDGNDIEVVKKEADATGKDEKKDRHDEL